MPTPEEIREMEHMHIKMSYNKIEELIYAGNNMCCQGHFEEELLSQGITADISLEAERLDNPEGVRYFFWFPWKEDTAPDIELMNLGLDVLDNLMKSNIKTYVHCRNGHGRTTTFLISYFMRKYKISLDKAISLVKEKRPSGHFNNEQKNFLIEFEKRMRI